MSKSRHLEGMIADVGAVGLSAGSAKPCFGPLLMPKSVFVAIR